MTLNNRDETRLDRIHRALLDASPPDGGDWLKTTTKPDDSIVDTREDAE